MKKQNKANWVYEIFAPLTVLATLVGLWFIGLLVYAAHVPPEVSEWKEVTVVSRTELTVPCGFASETEVTLLFSDGTTWKGYPSSAKPNECHLLYAQEGDVECYRYHSHYFSGKQWR